MRGDRLSKLILVAPAAFKGSFSPRAVADAIAVGVRRAMPEATVLVCPIAEGGGALADLATWASGWGLEAQVIALADVTTPLVGPEGAAPVFGPQKGATADNVARLAAGLDRLAGLMAGQGHPELATLPGGG